MSQYLNNNLMELLDGIPLGEESKYGFNNRDEIMQAAMGMPYQEYDLDNEKPTGYWRLRVVVGDENRVLIRLKNTAEGWKFSGLGGAALAQNLGDHEANMISQGKSPRTGRIIRDFSMRCDYVQFDQEQDAILSGTVYPLWSASRFISVYGAQNGAAVEDYVAYDLSTVNEIRMKAQEIMGDPNSFKNSDWGK
jgi:hypothetical protein